MVLLGSSCYLAMNKWEEDYPDTEAIYNCTFLEYQNNFFIWLSKLSLSKIFSH